MNIPAEHRKCPASKLTALHQNVDALIAEVRREGDAQAEGWKGEIDRAGFADSALNLAHYLALRRRDLRPLQRPLTALGLSSLGRLESRVLPTLIAVRTALAALLGRVTDPEPSPADFFAGEARLASHTHELLGTSATSAPVALLVTCPTEAADDPAFMLALAERGVEAVRINCAHDGADRWRSMIGHLRTAEAATGRRLKVFMDLAGPKIRTGEVRPSHGRPIRKGETIAIVRSGELDTNEVANEHFAIECTLAGALSSAKIDDHVYIDDGKLEAKVERVEAWGLLARVTAVAEKGLRLKPEKV